VPQPSAFEFEVAIEKLIRHKFPDTDRIPAEIIQAGSKSIRSEIHKLINSIWNKEKLSEKWNESIIVPLYIRKNLKSHRIVETEQGGKREPQRK
jgi:hypothetical protein